MLLLCCGDGGSSMSTVMVPDGEGTISSKAGTMLPLCCGDIACGGRRPSRVVRHRHPLVQRHMCHWPELQVSGKSCTCAGLNVHAA